MIVSELFIAHSLIAPLKDWIFNAHSFDINLVIFLLKFFLNSLDLAYDVQ